MATDPKITTLAQAIAKLNLQEMHELFSILEENHNVNIQSVMAFVPITSRGNEYTGDIWFSPAEIEYNPKGSRYQLVLMDCGGSRLQVVKTIKEITNLGLYKSKELTDKLPSIILEVSDYNKAEEIQKIFEHIGAEMDIHPIN